MSLLTNILKATTIKNNKRIVDVTPSTGEIQITEQELNTRLTTFEVVRRFLPKAIGKEYESVLPKNFFLDCFNDCVDEYELDHNTITRDECVEKTLEFDEKLSDLCKFILKTIRPITSVVYSDDKFKVKESDLQYESFTIKNKLVVGKECERCGRTFEEGGEHYPVESNISYIQFPSLKKIVSKRTIINDLIESVPKILYKLNELSNISAYIDPKENVFKKFAASVWIYMKGNYESDFPRSIVNYSAFQFAVPGYPFKTPTSRIYSVSNVPNNVTNKLQIEEVFIKNITALTDYLCDATKLLSVDDVSELSVDDKTIVVKNIYASIIVILSLYGEVKLWEDVINGNIFIKDADKQCHLLDTKGVQINEIIRK